MGSSWRTETRNLKPVYSIQMLANSTVRKISTVLTGQYRVVVLSTLAGAESELPQSSALAPKFPQCKKFFLIGPDTKFHSRLHAGHKEHFR